MNFETACKEGNLELVKELYHNILELEFTIGFENACKNGHLPIIKYLSSKPQIRPYYWSYIINNWNLEIAQYFQTVYKPQDIWINVALINENYDIAKFIISCGALPTESSLQAAIQTNALNQIGSYYSKRQKIETRKFTDMEIIKYLLDYNVPIPRNILSYTLDLGRKDLAKYFIWNCYNIGPNFELADEIVNEMNPIISEYIGEDISSIIFEYIFYTL